MGGVIAVDDVGNSKGVSPEVTRRRGGNGPTLLSVIGPDTEQVKEVVSGLRVRLPGHRILVGVGPDVADGVIAVASTDSENAEILRAVRNAMGGCVFYTAGTEDNAGDSSGAVGSEVHTEPGITVVRWQSGASFTVDLDRLAQVIEQLWIDIPRWVSDARRVDADRIDRVRVAIRLTAEKYAAELVGPEAATPSGRVELSALYRARLRCLVLEHGAEWPHLAEMPELVAEAVELAGLAGMRDAVADTRALEQDRENRMRIALVVAMSLGGGVAVAVALSRLVGPLGGVVCGCVVSGVLAVIRWRMFAEARRAQSMERGVAILRRQWSAEVTEVVARLRIPSVAEAIVQEVRA